ncbi:unnamed protein product [Rotaria sp. Silwood1]|nr:unnamed protein product [Rotaria sp. Silwood1]CAF4733278.1 unnamed protein product [Rotaria sp. Silwood1]
MSNLLVQEEKKKISETINQHLTKSFSLLTSPRTSIVHQYSSNQIFENTFDENNKQSEQLSFLHRLTLSFHQSIHHKNQHNKYIKQTNIDSIEKYLANESNESVNIQSTSCKFDNRKFLFATFSFQISQVTSDKKYCHELLNRISTLWFGSNAERRQVFDLLEQNQIKCKILPEFIAHLAHSFSKHAIDIHDISIRKTMLYEALELSKKALNSNENCALCHFSYGHIIGVLLDINDFSLKDKLNKASLFKHHMKKTIEIDKNFYEAYAYLGRYEYTAFNLNLFERKAALLLGYTIEGNLDKALEYFHIAIKGNYDMIHTVYLLIGKIYQKKKQYVEAKKYLKICIQIPIQRKSQTNIVNNAKILLKDKKFENLSFETFINHLKN